MTLVLPTHRPDELPHVANRLAQTIALFRTHAGMDMAFGGRTLPGRKAFEISDLSGARTRSLARLVVPSGAGLGGKALALKRPVSVTSYHAAQGITHHFDAQVRDEGLETVVAVPVLAAGKARMVIYVGSRSEISLGDRWFDDFVPLVRALEREFEVEDEVRRRLASLSFQPESESNIDQRGLTRADIADICEELTALATEVADQGLRRRLHSLRERMEAPARPFSAGNTQVQLAPRELAVLQQVAAGRSNREAAESLGLLTNTVKSYLKTAMRKLHANNRVQAIIAAREAGLIS